MFGNSIWASKSYEITLQLLYVVLEEIKARSTGTVRVLLYVEGRRRGRGEKGGEGREGGRGAGDSRREERGEELILTI